MQNIDIAFITRSKIYSPNNVNSDAEILRMTAENLRTKYADIRFYDEDTVDFNTINQRVIVNMCRKESSIKKLQELEKEGHIVVNSGFGIENCTRERMTRILEECGVPVPESIISDTNAEDVKRQLDEAGFKNCWIKRGESHSVHKEDVSFARHSDEAEELIREYRLRGINRVVINRHLKGDLVKFYGIRDSDFFYAFYPFEVGHSKFGQEEINGPIHHYHFDIDFLKEACQKASEAMNVDVFGGDCIVDKDGNTAIIDFNDWPSFSPCRADGSKAIADFICRKIEKSI